MRQAILVDRQGRVASLFDRIPAVVMRKLWQALDERWWSGTVAETVERDIDHDMEQFTNDTADYKIGFVSGFCVAVEIMHQVLEDQQYETLSDKAVQTIDMMVSAVHWFAARISDAIPRTYTDTYVPYDVSDTPNSEGAN